jgi:hypothetical protein
VLCVDRVYLHSFMSPLNRFASYSTKANLVQAQTQRIKLLDAHAGELQKRQRQARAALAAGWHGTAAAAHAQRRALQTAALQPDDYTHALPLRDDMHGRTAMRARARDYREDLNVQIARKKVRVSVTSCMP